MQTILLAGGAGFTGSNLCKTPLQKDSPNDDPKRRLLV